MQKKSAKNADSRNAKSTRDVRKKVINLRPAVDQMTFKDGKKVLYSDRHLKLVAEVRRGQVVALRPFHVSGKITRMHTHPAQSLTGRWCIICYNLDQPLDSNCIEVPCWLLPILRGIRWAG